MNKLENKQRITEIIMKPIAFTKCEIGKDWYKNEMEIIFTPGIYYPDYIEVNDFVMKEIDGKELNIEDVVKEIFDLLSSYEPVHLKVIDHIKGCKTHFDVDVIKEAVCDNLL